MASAKPVFHFRMFWFLNPVKSDSLVNGLAYVVASPTWLLFPAYGGVVYRFTMPALLGEVWIMLWLLIRGAEADTGSCRPSFIVPAISPVSGSRLIYKLRAIRSPLALVVDVGAEPRL